MEIQTDIETLQTKLLEIEFYDFLGRKLHQVQLNNPNTRISADVINRKGLSIVLVRDKNTGRRLAVEKIILM